MPLLAAGNPIAACMQRKGYKGLVAIDGSLEVLGEPAVAIVPCDCASDHQAPWEKLKAIGGIGPSDDLKCPFPDLAEGAAQFLAGMAAVGKDVRSQGKDYRIDARTAGAPSRSWMLALCTMAVTSRPPVSVRIWRLRPLILLPASNPRGPPFSVVLTDRLLITPAEGLAACVSISSK